MNSEWRSPVYLIGGTLAVLGALTGILTSLGGTNSGQGLQSEALDWDQFAVPAAIDAENHELSSIYLAQKLLDSGAFGKDDSGNPLRLAGFADERGANQADAENTEIIQPFPPVIAAAIVDANPTVYLQLDDGQVAALMEGDTLHSGWTVTSITLSRIQARHGSDEPVSYPVFRHEIPAPKKSKKRQ